MTRISDATLDHLRRAADWPDAQGTRYEIRERLGSGGMGAVYLARDRELDRDVALKVLNDPEPSPEAAERLRDEARIIARLEHPGIVPVHDAGVLPDGRAFYVMKRVEGERLDRAAALTPLTQRLRWFERICEPVAFAHARGILHRDLKPENVMIGAMGEVLVMDWGLAAAGPAWVAGTPGYMAPESTGGSLPDLRADIWSLGAVLHFLLMGLPPDPGGDPGAALRRANVPRPLQSVCLKALAADVAARYASVPELAADIGRFVVRERVHAHHETLGEKARRQFERYRMPIALIGAYLIMRVVFEIFSRR